MSRIVEIKLLIFFMFFGTLTLLSCEQISDITLDSLNDYNMNIEDIIGNRLAITTVEVQNMKGSGYNYYSFSDKEIIEIVLKYNGYIYLFLADRETRIITDSVCKKQAESLHSFTDLNIVIDGNPLYDQRVEVIMKKKENSLEYDYFVLDIYEINSETYKYQTVEYDQIEILPVEW
jgi:hypothetical protein